MAFAAGPWCQATAYLRAIAPIVCVPTQLPASNGKLPIAACDRKLSDHVTAMTANHSVYM